MRAAWQRTNTVVPANLMTEEELLAAPMKHSAEVHGDDGIHLDCAECLEHGCKLLALFRITPEQYVESFGWLPRGKDHPVLLAIAEALVAAGRKHG